uniref:PLAT domain-containing protein n=1 Tax=Ciona savignyi TaxID=51511 RepID=H2ZAW8_CIOSA
MEPIGGKKGDLYTFKCGKWLDTNEGDGEVIREIPSTGPGVKRPQPLVRYSVSVVTGDKRGAGTDANVSCCLYGRQGDTGNRPLTASKNNRNKFERGQSDEFTIEAVDLKSVKKVKIGHDDSGVGDGWFLKEVIVRDEATGESTTFPCDRWLATDEDDGAIVRELTSEGSPQLLNTTSYHVAVKTGDIRGAGTDADVYIQIYGSDGDTGRLKLTRGENIRNKFERGRTDKFKLEATDIGRLERIYIGHSDSGIGAGWFLDGIEIDVPSSGMHYTFKANRWLASDEGDGKTEIELYPTQTRQQDKLLPYEITVATGDTLNAGTDAQVVLQLYGEDGKSEVMKLRNKTDNFERKAIDKFKIEAPDIGPITKIRIGHDGRGVGSGWFLDSVKIQRFVHKTSKRKKRRREPQPKIRMFLRKKNRILMFINWKKTKEHKRGLNEDLEEPSSSSSSSESSSDSDSNIEHEEEIHADEDVTDDGMKKAEVSNTQPDVKQVASDGSEDQQYKVHVFTGDVFRGGTDANVFITIFGENGDTGERKLLKSETNTDKFERGKEDIFKLDAVDLGKLFKVHIRHDNALIQPAWFLDRVEIEDTDTGSIYVFHCERWLAKNKEDGKIAR